ncbi:MAG: hypothetical protein AB1916_12030 [Thermodesulfobacteriota bacterium]
MRRSGLAALLFPLALVLAAGVAGAGERPALLTLAYTANSLGEFRECPVCGAEALGGLGRRATVFKDLRAEGKGKVMFFAGPYEFTPVVVRRPGSPDLARALAQAYGLLGYDLGAVTPQEAEWLAAAGASLPGAWRRLDDKPHTVLIDRDGVKVAAVLFPAVDAARDPAAFEAALQAVRAEAGRSRSRAALVVGVSPWGERAEGKFLEAAPGAVDVLLGGGQAMGYGVRPAAGGRTVWVRPPFDGRGVVVFDLLALPRGPERAWKPGEHYAAEVRMLEQSIPQDPAAVNLFNGL